MGEERRAQGRASFGSYRMTGADVVHVAAHTAFDADPIAPGLVVGAVNAAVLVSRAERGRRSTKRARSEFGESRRVLPEPLRLVRVDRPGRDPGTGPARGGDRRDVAVLAIHARAVRQQW